MTLLNADQLVALMSMLEAELDKDQDVEFISFYIGALIETILAKIEITDGKISCLDTKVVCLAASCLANMCNHEDRIEMILSSLKHTPNQQKMFYKSLDFFTCLSVDKKLQNIFQTLLLNLSRSSEIVDQYLEFIPADLLIEKVWPRLKELLSLMILQNFCSSTSVRQQLLQDNHTVVDVLLDSLVSSQNLRVRQSVSAILKNCLFDTSHHLLILTAPVELVERLCLPLCTTESCLDEEDRQKLPLRIRNVPGSPEAHTETDFQVLRNILDALFLFCNRPDTRNILRSKSVYFVLRDFHTHVAKRMKESEEGGETSLCKDYRLVNIVVENIVDQLICEEKERPEKFATKSLKDIPVDEKMKCVVSE